MINYNVVQVVKPFHLYTHSLYAYTLHEASSFTELHHWFTHVFHAGKATVI